MHTMESLKARTVEEGDCLLWNGYYGNGVPMVSDGEKMVPVRRLMHSIMGKEVRKGFFSASCGHKGCVNPEHIVFRLPKAHMKSMNQQEFSRERVLRMTQARRKRTDIVLSESIAREIRLMDGTCKEVGQRFGVTKTVVSRIRRGVYWPEVNSPWAGLMR